jgi:hypothetical protein
MSNNQSNETWRPGERPDEVPTQPYDPEKAPANEPLTPEPSKQPDPMPVPPDVEPKSPVQEPETPMPMIDPPEQKAPERLV